MGSFIEFISTQSKIIKQNLDLKELQRIFDLIALEHQSDFKFNYLTYLTDLDVFSTVDKKFVKKEISFLIQNLNKSSSFLRIINEINLPNLEPIYSGDVFSTLENLKDFTKDLDTFLLNEVQHLELIKDVACPPTNW